MRFLRQPGDNLEVECHPAFVPWNLSQKPIIKPFPPPEPATTKIESYARHKDQVQLV